MNSKESLNFKGNIYEDIYEINIYKEIIKYI